MSARRPLGSGSRSQAGLPSRLSCAQASWEARHCIGGEGEGGVGLQPVAVAREREREWVVYIMIMIIIILGGGGGLNTST